MKGYEDIAEESLLDVAKKMAVAARTAPKGKGVDNMAIAIALREDILKISEKLHELGERYDVPSFRRDAENIKNVSVMLLLGTKFKPLGLKKCGMCGLGNCSENEKHPEIPCAFNTGDLGIAVGSAVSVASDMRVDNRIMYTVGQAVVEINMLGEDVKIVYAIPLSATSKNPFFDRK